MVRPNRAEQLSRRGLQVVSPHGDFALPVSTVTSDAIRAPFDLILVGVKAYSLDEAMDQFAPAVGPSTMILPILNGIAHVDRLIARFGSSSVLGGIANISAAIDAEGRIIHLVPLNDLVFGELSGGINARIRSVLSSFEGAGFNTRASEAVMQDMWEKFAQLGVGASITCLMRSSIGDIVAAPGGREAALKLFDECCAVATASGFRPRPVFIDFASKLVTTAGSALKWSMLRDIERGSVTEGPHILGDLVSRARAAGVETPILDLAWTHVAAYEVARSHARAAH